MNHFRIKPSPGAKVRDPVTNKHLQEVGSDGQPGELKPKSSYWIRRKNEGVVVIVVEATDKKAGK